MVTCFPPLQPARRLRVRCAADAQRMRSVCAVDAGVKTTLSDPRVGWAARRGGAKMAGKNFSPSAVIHAVWLLL